MYTQPVEDTVPKVNNEIAVGEDLDFQRRWWRFENWAWKIFAALIVLDLVGAFGRGPIANGSASAGDAMRIKYERIERFSTPSIMRIKFGPSAVRDGKIQLWAGQNLVDELGNQRVVPQPVESRVGNNGILYTFAAAQAPAEISFALEPSSLGLRHLILKVPKVAEIELSIFVVP